MDISIVIPAYNEETRIIPTLEKVYGYFASMGTEFEIIVVDDGSKDNTVEIVKQWQRTRKIPSPSRGEGRGEGAKEKTVKIISHSANRGKGAAVRTGVLEAGGELILFSDADLSTPIEEFEKLKKAVDDGYDIAIGSRGLPDSKIAVPQPWYRRYVGKIFPYLVRLIVMKNFRDTQCGFKLFKKEAGKALFGELQTAGFAFDVEILYRAVKSGLKTKEIPVVWLNSPQSKVTMIKEPFKMLVAVLKIRKNISIKTNGGSGRDNTIFMPEDHMDKLYNNPNPIVRSVHNGRLNSIAELIPKREGLKILDAGCGEGHLIGKLAAGSRTNAFFGVDVTMGALAKAACRCPSANFTEGDIACLSFLEDEFFDVIICTEVLEHISEYRKAIQELKRLLKKEGILIITFPNEKLWTLGRFFLGRRPVKVPDHVNSFTPGKIIHAVDLKCINRKNLPFKLPFFISLCGIIEFKK